MLKPALNTGLDPDNYIVCSNFSYTQTEAEVVFLWLQRKFNFYTLQKWDELLMFFF